MSDLRRVALFGPNGTVGRAWHAVGPRRGVEVAPIDRGVLDLGLSRREPAVFASRLDAIFDDAAPDLVVNAAAWTDLESAETDAEGAYAVNADAPRLIAGACARRGIPVLHYSTDYVFCERSLGDGPARVDDELTPRGVYAESKAEGERAVAAAAGDHLIVRTSWVHAPWCGGFIRAVTRRMIGGGAVAVVEGQRSRPTEALGLASRSLDLAQAGARGVFHIADDGDGADGAPGCSRPLLARAMADVLGFEGEIGTRTPEEMGDTAPRPADSVLDLSAAQSVIGGGWPHWTEGLARTLRGMAGAGV